MGEGLYSRFSVAAHTVLAFYNGIRTTDKDMNRYIVIQNIRWNFNKTKL